MEFNFDGFARLNALGPTDERELELVIAASTSADNDLNARARDQGVAAVESAQDDIIGAINCGIVCQRGMKRIERMPP